MIVVPVIDIKDGLVVRAIRGLRDLYKPISDSVYGTCDPLKLAYKFMLEGFKVIYIADLDSILNGRINEAIFNSLRREARIKIMADIGVDCEEKLEKAVQIADYPVIATESAPSLNFLSRALKACNSNVFLSIDLKNDAIVSRAPEIAGKNLEEACEILSKLNVRKIILMDFNRIGSCSGPNIDGAKYLVRRGFEVYVGGGVRGLVDIIELCREGVSGVLVGSALHSGKVRVQDLKSLGFI
ncbi:MAG: HisA/HisF-related TIM barrel protein [Candidatus Nezhaarchaeales archaeon]